MNEHVQVDEGRPGCIGVHYRASIPAAAAHFHAAGFRGIRNMQIVQSSLDCNEARRRALDRAQRSEDLKCFWQGDWDYSAGRCALYQFDFDSYEGARFNAPRTPDTEAHVDWEPESPDPDDS